MNLENFTIKFLTIDEQQILQTHINKSTYDRNYGYKYISNDKSIITPNIMLISNPLITEQNLKDIYDNNIPIIFLTSYICNGQGREFWNDIHRNVSKNKFFFKKYFYTHMKKNQPTRSIWQFCEDNNNITHNKIVNYLNEIFILLKELLIFDITTLVFKLYIDCIFI